MNTYGTDEFSNDEADGDDDDDNVKTENEKDGEQKKSLKEQYAAMQDIILKGQSILGMVAHILESCTNVFNFCVPFLSWLAFVVLFVATVILYHIPLRYIIMLWGTNKFTKRLRNPNAISNNELADFISRVPDNEELVSCLSSEFY